MKTSIFALPDKKMSFFAAVDYAKELGVNAIEPYPQAEFCTPDTEAARRLAAYAEEKEIEICCFSMGGNLTCRDQKAEVERLKQYVDTAAAMGAKYFHHTLAPRLDLFTTEPFSSFALLIKYIAEGVREVYDYAMQQGVRCIYEDQGLVVNGMQRFGEFLDTVNRDVGVLADLGNTLFVGENPAEFVACFASSICHVHVKDYLRIGRNTPDTQPGWYHLTDGSYLCGTAAGNGIVHFPRILDILRRNGYDGFYSLEYDGPEDAYQANAASLDYLSRFTIGSASPDNTLF